jgi:hypothetical protein
MYTLQGLYIHSRKSLHKLYRLWVEFTGTLHGVYIEYVHYSGTQCKLMGECQIQAEDLAVIFFYKWYCKNGLPLEIVLNCDKLFMSKFWQVLHKLIGIKLKMSMVYHSESDGVSKQTNKTVNQCLCYHVEHNQMGWQWAQFDIMNAVNSSTWFSPFQLHMGQAPQIILPLV